MSIFGKIKDAILGRKASDQPLRSERPGQAQPHGQALPRGKARQLHRRAGDVDGDAILAKAATPRVGANSKLDVDWMRCRPRRQLRNRKESPPSWLPATRTAARRLGCTGVSRSSRQRRNSFG